MAVALLNGDQRVLFATARSRGGWAPMAAPGERRRRVFPITERDSRTAGTYGPTRCAVRRPRKERDNGDTDSRVVPSSHHHDRLGGGRDRRLLGTAHVV